MTSASTGGSTYAPTGGMTLISTGGATSTGGTTSVPTLTGGTVSAGGTTSLPVRPDASPDSATCGGLDQACCSSLYLQTGDPCSAQWTACFDPDGSDGTLGTCVACGGQNQKACWVDNLTTMTAVYSCQGGLVQTYNASGTTICTVPDAGTPVDLKPATPDTSPDTLPASTCGGSGQPCCGTTSTKLGTCNSPLYSYCMANAYGTTTGICFSCGGENQEVCTSTTPCQPGLTVIDCGEDLYSQAGSPFDVMCEACFGSTWNCCVNCPSQYVNTTAGECFPPTTQ